MKILVLISILFVSFFQTSCATNSDQKATLTYASDATRYIVKTRYTIGTFSTRGDRAAHLQSKAGPENVIEAIDDDVFVIDFKNIEKIKSTLEELQKSEEVVFIEPDVKAYALHTPNDPSFPAQWAHAKIQSELAWDYTMGSHSVIVAIVDTGMDYTHPDLAANVWTNPGEIAANGRDDDGNGYVDDVHGYDFVNNDGDPMADDTPEFHGTHTAGSVGAVGDNNLGVIGHSPVVKIMPLKFLASNGSGQVSDAIRAINYAITKGAKIISNSWGSNQGSQALADAIGKAQQAGILFVAAAGNGGQDGIGDNNDAVANYPSNYAYDNVIAVASTNQSDGLSTFSNYGPHTVHVGAPGEGILSTKNGGQYQYMSGTSMSTPLVSGVLALMIAERPDMNYKQIKQALIANVDVVPSLQGRVVSNGRVNAYKALKAIAIASPTPTPVPTATPLPTSTPKPTATPVPTSTPKPTATPFPTATPVPTPPSSSTAQTPLILGQTAIIVSNPNAQIYVDYDISNFTQAVYAYVEVSKPNQGFNNVNGTTPDSKHLFYFLGKAPKGRVTIIPTVQLPGWGTYSIRVMPVNGAQQSVGQFSDAALLFLRSP